MSVTSTAARAYDAVHAAYLDAVKGSELAHVSDFFSRTMRPAIYLETAKDLTEDMLLGSSRLGGLPDLCRGTPWPTHEFGSYRFVAQFNLAELPVLPQSLVVPDGGRDDVPAFFHAEGLLSFFVADTPDQDVFWQHDGYVKALYTAPAQFSELETVAVPPLMQGEPAATGHPCLPLARSTVGCQPPFRQQCVQPPDVWPLNEEETDSYVYETLLDEQQVTSDYLFGYPMHHTLCYDPTPEPRAEYVHLMGLHSIDSLQWCWHDGDRLSVFIRKDDLLRGDFSALKCDAG